MFTSEVKLKYHKDKEAAKNNGGEYQCSVCPKVFNFKKHQVQHEKTHNKESNKQICQDCGKTLGSTAALNRHVKAQLAITSPVQSAPRFSLKRSSSTIMSEPIVWKSHISVVTVTTNLA